MFHICRYSKWEDLKIVDVYDNSSSTEMPYERVVVQQRHCIVCNKKKTRRVKV